MCVRKKETFSLLTYDNSTYHTLAFYFSECIRLDLPRLLLPFPTDSHESHEY